MAVNRLLNYTFTGGLWVLDVGQPDYDLKKQMMVPFGNLGESLILGSDTDFVAGICKLMFPYAAMQFGTAQAPPTNRYSTGYVQGLMFTRPTVSTIQTGSGSARDDTDAFDLVVTSMLTADITATGAGGRNAETPEQADKWYARFLIGDTSLQNPVALFLVNQDDLLTFALPAGYDVKRQLGGCRNDASSNLRNVEVHGTGTARVCHYAYTNRTDLLVFAAAEPIVWTIGDASEFVPPWARMCELQLQSALGSSDYMEFRYAGSGISNAAGRRIYGTSFIPKTDTVILALNASQQFEYRRNNVTGSGADCRIFTYWEYY